MALFDYSKRIEQDEAQFEAQTAKNVVKSLKSVDLSAVKSVETERAETERDNKDVTKGVLKAYPSERVSISKLSGLLRVNLADEASQTGYGFVMLKSSNVQPTINQNGSPVSGRVDVIVENTDKSMPNYSVIKNGKPRKSQRDIKDVLDAWETERMSELAAARDVIPSASVSSTKQNFEKGSEF